MLKDIFGKKDNPLGGGESFDVLLAELVVAQEKRERGALDKISQMAPEDLKDRYADVLGENSLGLFNSSRNEHSSSTPKMFFQSIDYKLSKDRRETSEDFKKADFEETKSSIKMQMTYESTFIEVLRLLSNNSDIEDIGKTYSSPVYLKFQDIPTYYNENKPIDKSDLIQAIVDNALYCIAFNQKINIPANIRAKALKKITRFGYLFDTEKNKAYNSLAILPSKILEQKTPRLPLRYCTEEMLGVNMPKGHTRQNLIALPDQFTTEIGNLLGTYTHENNQIIIEKLLNEAIQKDPLNALQFFVFLVSCAPDANKLFELVKSLDDNQLEKIFSPKASFFTETDSTIFSASSVGDFRLGKISGVESNAPELPTDLAGSHRLIRGLQAQIKTLSSELKQQITKMRDTEQRYQTEIKILQSKANRPEWFLVSIGKFGIDWDYFIESCKTDDGKETLKTIIGVLYLQKIKDLNKKYDVTILNDPKTEGHQELMQLNNLRDSAIECITKTKIT